MSQIDLLSGEAEEPLTLATPAVRVRGRIMALLLAIPPGFGRSTVDLADSTKLPHADVRKRVLELAAAGLVNTGCQRQRQVNGSYLPLYQATARARALDNTPHKE